MRGEVFHEQPAGRTNPGASRVSFGPQGLRGEVSVPPLVRRSITVVPFPSVISSLYRRGNRRLQNVILCERSGAEELSSDIGRLLVHPSSTIVNTVVATVT